MSESTLRHWKIVPFCGAGPLTFGHKREQVRVLLGRDVSTFKKVPLATNDTDCYSTLGVHAYFDRDERLECIELFEPCQPSYRGIDLLHRPVAEILRDLDRLGLSYRYDDGYFVDECGFVLYAPEDVVKAVTVYRDGYFSNED